MSARPKEIAQLIEWLREPGRNLSRSGGWRDYDDAFTPTTCCAVWRLFEIGGLVPNRTADMPAMSATEEFAKTLGVWDHFPTLFRLSDSGGPLAVADYLEAEFPL